MNVVGLVADPTARSMDREPGAKVAPGAVGRPPTPAPRALPTRLHHTARQWRQEFETSVWLPVAARVLGAGGLMLALAAVGAASILAGSGVDAPLAAKAEVGGAWLRPSPLDSAEPPPQPPGRRSLGALAHPHPRRDGGVPSPGVTADGKVILNAATSSDLTRLPGVGPKRADAIVKLRKRLKRFRRITDLLRVRGIGVRSLRRIKPLVVLDPPPKEDGGTRG